MVEEKSQQVIPLSHFMFLLIVLVHHGASKHVTHVKHGRRGNSRKIHLEDLGVVHISSSNSARTPPTGKKHGVYLFIFNRLKLFQMPII